MEYNFDQVIERRGTHSCKWDEESGKILPMWVADMDFPVAQPIQEAIKARANHPIYGYASLPDSYGAAVCHWFAKRHHWSIDPQWISFSPGVVSGLHFLVQLWTQPGDKVLIHDPVYYPFMAAPRDNGRIPVCNELQYSKGHYEIDFADFQAKAKDPKVKLFLLSNPQNPGSRVWTRAELAQMADICLANQVLMVSDEIHCDLVFPGHQHVPLASLSPEISQRVITCVSPSKTFNIAGLQTSCLIIENPLLRQQYQGYLAKLGMHEPNIFGLEALIAAYQEGEEWLEQLLVYLKGNGDYVKSRLKQNLPALGMTDLAATYLVWLDCRQMLDCRPANLRDQAQRLHQQLLSKGRLWLDPGYKFGWAGSGFERINIACPRSVLAEGMNRLEQGCKNWQI